MAFKITTGAGRSRGSQASGSSMMPFIQQMAMLQGLSQKAQVGGTGQAPAPLGMIQTSYKSPYGGESVSPEAEGEVAAAKDFATEAQQVNIRTDAAFSQLGYGVSRFKGLEAANKSQGISGVGQRVAGTIGHIKGIVGANPEDTAWNEYTKGVATQLAAAASPRTPTLLVDYYQKQLGPSNQTSDEFAGRVHNLVSEFTGRRMAYNKIPYDQRIADTKTAEILSQPAAKDIHSWYPSAKGSSPIPGSPGNLDQETLDAKAAINAGAPREKVAQHFKMKTGRDYNG